MHLHNLLLGISWTLRGLGRLCTVPCCHGDDDVLPSFWKAIRQSWVISQISHWSSYNEGQGWKLGIIYGHGFLETGKYVHIINNYYYCFIIHSRLSKVAGCWRKSPPTWLVLAGYSAWHFFTDGVFYIKYPWTGRLLWQLSHLLQNSLTTLFI